MRWRRSSLYANKIGWTGMLAIGALEEAAVFSSCCSFLFFFVAPASFPNTLRFCVQSPTISHPQPPTLRAGSRRETGASGQTYPCRYGLEGLDRYARKSDPHTATIL